MKQIVICGAGEVGRHAAEVFTEIGHEVIVVDMSTGCLQEVLESVDVHSLRGSACHPDTLIEAKVQSCDLLIAATDSDEVNLLAAALGKGMGARYVVARIHNRSYFCQGSFDFRNHLQIDHLICPEHLTSAEIAANIADPGVMEIQHFAQNQIEMHRYLMDDESKGIGTELSKMDLPSGIRLAVIQRGERFFAPDSKTRLEHGDIVTLLGRPEQFSMITDVFRRHVTSNNKVAIIGGTSMGEWLAEELHARNFSIRLFETGRDRALELAERYPYLTVINTDPTSPDSFFEEHLENCMAYVAATDNDEHSIIAALQAKRLGVKTVSCIVHSPTFLDMLAGLGIDQPYCPRVVAAKSLLKLVDSSPIKHISTLAPEVSEVFEIEKVSSQGESVGQELRSISLPRGAFVAATQRNGKVIVPGASDRILAGDSLVIIGPKKMSRQLEKMFIR